MWGWIYKEGEENSPFAFGIYAGLQKEVCPFPCSVFSLWARETEMLRWRIKEGGFKEGGMDYDFHSPVIHLVWGGSEADEVLTAMWGKEYCAYTYRMLATASLRPFLTIMLQLAIAYNWDICWQTNHSIFFPINLSLFC